MSEFEPYTFENPAGTRWSLEINHGKKNRIKAVCGVDLSKLFELKLAPIDELANDRDKLIEAVWILIEDQARDRGVTKEAFCDPLSGPTLDAAQDALVEAAILFSPPHHREIVRGALRKGAELQAKVGSHALESIDVDSLAKKLTDSPGNVPES